MGWLLGLISPAPATTGSPIDFAQGRAIHQQHCAACQGPEGRGDAERCISLTPRPANLISAQTSAKSDQELLKIIAKGRPRTAMEGWENQLRPEDQVTVLAYIRS